MRTILLLVVVAVVVAEKTALQKLVHLLQLRPELHNTRSLNANTPTAKWALQEYGCLDEAQRLQIDDVLDQAVANLKQKKYGNPDTLHKLLSEKFIHGIDDDGMQHKAESAAPSTTSQQVKREARGKRDDVPSGADLHTYPTDFVVTDLVFPTNGKDFMSQPIPIFSVSGLSGGAGSCSTTLWPTLQDSGRVLALWKELQEIFLNAVQICDFLPETYGARSICLGVIEFTGAFLSAVAEYRYRHSLLCRNVLDYASIQSLLDNTIAVHRQVMLMRRLQLEDALYADSMVASLAVPQAKGGQFEAACYVANDVYQLGQYYDIFTVGQNVTANRYLSSVSGSTPYISNMNALRNAYNNMALLDKEDDSNFPDPLVEADMTKNRPSFHDKCFFNTNSVPTLA